MTDSKNIVSAMVGKTIIKIYGGKQDDDTLLLVMQDGSVYGFHHDQDCCEIVYIEDVCGDLSDLMGHPLIQAAEESIKDQPKGYILPRMSGESETWTFYKFATNKGGVTIRWYGSSSEYDSESDESVSVVSFSNVDAIPWQFFDERLVEGSEPDAVKVFEYNPVVSIDVEAVPVASKIQSPYWMRVMERNKENFLAEIKTKAVELEILLNKINDPRYRELATTALEESFLWAVKGVYVPGKDR